ncbi:MAG: metal ABC transporter substrate-binding protein, partial [Treponema sp.]|nr:metal ABC transporter substrate-binding protein [Treponema sp.]
MKRIFISVCIALLFTAVLSARPKQDGAGNKNADGRISVVTTNFPPYDFVRAIAGDKVNLTMLLPPGAESHSYDPTPRDIIAIQKSNLFIYTGGESDFWVDRILGSVDSDSMKILAMLDTVDAVEEEIVEGMQEEGEGEEGPEYDEHVWTSPKNAQRIITAITEALCEIDGANAALYRQNAANYKARL